MLPASFRSLPPPGGCSPTLLRLQEELRAARGAGQDRAQGSCPRARLFCCLISRRRRRRRASSRRRSRHRRLCRPRLQSARTACRAGRVKTATFAGPLRSAFQHTARLGLCSAHSLHQRAHAIAAASALKSRLLAAPGGKGPHIRPQNNLISQAGLEGRSVCGAHGRGPQRRRADPCPVSPLSLSLSLSLLPQLLTTHSRRRQHHTQLANHRSLSA